MAKAYVVYLDQADKKLGEMNEKEEDKIADFFAHLGYGGEIFSELTGNTTSFEAGSSRKAKYVEDEPLAARFVSYTGKSVELLPDAKK